MLLPILHVVAEHLDHEVEVKLPGSAETEEEAVIVPRVDGSLIDLDPFFKLSETLLLRWRKVIQITTKGNEKSGLLKIK